VTAIVVLLALIMAISIGWLVRQTMHVSPWLAEDGAQDFAVTDKFQVSNVKLGLGVFLAVATSLFALFISAYLIRMEAPDWDVLVDPNILWVNTLMLVVASIFLQRARNAEKLVDAVRMRNGLIIAGVFTFVFLIGQLEAWRQLDDAGYYLSGNPAYAFFYVFTALHGLHLLGGLWVWYKTVLKFADARDISEIGRSVELCAIYWHFLLFVWVVLFALLLYT
jgi:cytochrome c oxidase subunit III